MCNDIVKYFSENEVEKRSELLSLMDDWKKEISLKKKIKFYDDNKNYAPEDYFYYDGFFPNYYNQELKTLFIAREARYCSGEDFIENSLNYFKSDAKINDSIFWRRIFYMLYGIRTKGQYKFDDIPYPYDFIKEIDKINNYGFALMNISKYSNDRDDGGKKADVTLMNQFLEDSNLNKRNYFKEELEILDPDIIITANLWDGKIKEEYINICFNEMTSLKHIEGKASLFSMELNNKEIKVIDLYHFSMPGSDKEYYYDPVIDLLFNIDC
jgi:hypothetical protein